MSIYLHVMHPELICGRIKPLQCNIPFSPEICFKTILAVDFALCVKEFGTVIKYWCIRSAKLIK